MNFPDHFVWPDYEGGSIANIPATVAALLQVPFEGMPPLRGRLWQPVAKQAKRVVVLVLDAFGWNLFQQERTVIEEMLGKTAVWGPITSVFPSTTTAALSSIWTGATPGQHGLAGFRLFLRDYGVTTQMIQFSPAFASRRYPDALIRAGMEPTQFLHWPGVGEQLKQGGVPTYAFKGRDLVGSALSKMHGRGITHDHGIITVADLFVRLRLFLEKMAGEKLYALAYWPMVDTLSHVYNWQHPSVAAEVRSIFRLLRYELLDKLSDVAREETVLFITADHGQTVTPYDKQVFMDDHPQLREMLFMEPAGEARMVYLYAKHGRQADVLAYIRVVFNGRFTAFPAHEALEAGLFGPAPLAPVIADRIGDVVMVAHDGYSFYAGFDSEKTARVKGWHGSLTPPEMQVPWLGFAL